MSVLRTGLTVGLAIVSLGLAGSVRAEDVGRSPINPMQAVEKAKLKAFVQQPLFNPARVLPAVPAPVAFAPSFVLPPPPPPSLQLVGVIEGINAVAIIRNGTSTTMLHAGERIGQWTVTILPTSLRLTNGDRVFDYALFGKAGSMPTPGVANVPAALVTHPNL